MARIRELIRDPEVWRSFDDDRGLRFRMKCKGGAVVCVVSRKALCGLPGLPPNVDDELLLAAFEKHLLRFEDVAEAKYVGGDVEDGEIRIHAWDYESDRATQGA